MTSARAGRLAAETKPKGAAPAAYRERPLHSANAGASQPAVLPSAKVAEVASPKSGSVDASPGAVLGMNSAGGILDPEQQSSGSSSQLAEAASSRAENLDQALREELAAEAETRGQLQEQVAVLSTRLQKAETEAYQLRAELLRSEAHRQSLEVALGTSKGSPSMVLLEPSDRELYPGEVRNLVLDILAAAQNSQPLDSRPQHLLTSLVEANPPTGERAAMRARLKELLRGYRSMTPQTRSGLTAMGFSIAEGGRHWKLVFNGDDRYTYSLPMSGSDFRGGLNAASDLGRLLI